jgi:lysophospholipase L1-like esterase
MKKVYFKRRASSFLIFIIFLLIGCDSGDNTSTNISDDYPVIRLYGDSNYTVEVNQTFHDPKAYAFDLEDGNITDKIIIIDDINYSKIGSYKITYQVTDSNDQTSSKERIINIVAPYVIDQKPTIKLIGSKTIFINTGNIYHEFGAKALDHEDGDISYKIIITDNINTSKTGKYTVKYEVNDSFGHITSVFRDVIVSNTNSNSFNDIKEIIKKSKEKEIKDATYICIGDSTRARSDKYHAEYYFDMIKERLDNYNLNSILFARIGFQAKQLDESSVRGMKIVDLLNKIPSDGNSTIIDISLGINDGWEGNINNTKTYLTNIIHKIYISKPNTKFMLTTPSRIRSETDTTNKLQKTYKDLSKELNLPLNNIIEEFMPSNNTTDLSLYRKINENRYDNVHLSQHGQILIAEYVLSNIL